MFLREQSWRNSFAMKLYGSCYLNWLIFYHKVHGVMVKWWRFWGHWGTLEIVKMWSWNILLFEEILHFATLRSEWQSSVFYLRLGICFSGKIIFETQRFFIIPMFLRKQSMNSLANWWSVCFKMFFSNGFICGVASTGSATVYENYFYALLFYFLNAKVFIL